MADRCRALLLVMLGLLCTQCFAGSGGVEAGEHAVDVVAGDHGSDAGDHGSDAGGHWSDDVEGWVYDMCEAIGLVVLVTIAVIFETGWHRAISLAQTSYRFGRLEAQRKSSRRKGSEKSNAEDHGGKLIHTALKGDFVDRMGGEFMTLGILSFFIFFCNLAGVFEQLALRVLSLSESEVEWPSTASDWLHLAEFVHMQLFLAMAMYFVIVACIVHGSVEQMEKWEELRLLGDRRKNSQQAASHDERQYFMWRQFFIESILDWKVDRPDLYTRVVTILDIGDEVVDKDKAIRSNTESCFSLATYLASNVEAGVLDLIEVHKPSWFALIIIFSIFTILHRYPKIEFATLKYAFLAFAILVAVCMTLLTRWRAKKLETAYTKIVADHKTQAANSARHSFSPIVIGVGAGLASAESQVEMFNQKHNTETMVLRALQVSLFVTSYGFARSMLDKHEWTHFPARAAMENMAFVILWMVFSTWLPQQVPRFLAIMALPPFVDDENCAVLFQTLVDDYFTQEDDALLGVASQGSRRSRHSTKTKVSADSPSQEVFQDLRRRVDRLEAAADLRQHIDKLHSRLDKLESRHCDGQWEGDIVAEGSVVSVAHLIVGSGDAEKDEGPEETGDDGTDAVTLNSVDVHGGVNAILGDGLLTGTPSKADRDLTVDSCSSHVLVGSGCVPPACGGMLGCFSSRERPLAGVSSRTERPV